MIAWAMMTAPRPVATIDRSLASFREAGFTDEVTIVEDMKRRGPLFTWRRAMKTMLAGNQGPFIGIMQDDILWARKSCSVLHKEMKEMGYRATGAGYLSLYVFEKHVLEPQVEKWRNWHVSHLGFKSAGAQCYILPRPSAMRLTKSSAFNYFCDTKKGDRKYGDDHVVSGILNMMAMRCWFRVPGLVSHQMGFNNSAIGHRASAWDASWEEVARAV
jgi:hypothetical protein